jgi:hypothetical protein
MVIVGRVTLLAQYHFRPPTSELPFPVSSGRSPLSGFAKGVLAGQSGTCLPAPVGSHTPGFETFSTSTLTGKSSVILA